MEGDQQRGVERRSLWQGFLLDAGASPDRNPVELFGSPIVTRIFVGTNSWHWRRLAWPALVAFGILLAGLGGAALAGMTALSLLLVLASGTGIGRSLAVSLTGAETKWDAALLLAGDGSMLHSRMMSETRTLLNVPLFSEPYVACVERAKRAKAPFNCKLEMPPLQGVP